MKQMDGAFLLTVLLACCNRWPMFRSHRLLRPQRSNYHCQNQFQSRTLSIFCFYSFQLITFFVISNYIVGEWMDTENARLIYFTLLFTQTITKFRIVFVVVCSDASTRFELQCSKDRYKLIIAYFCFMRLQCHWRLLPAFLFLFLENSRCCERNVYIREYSRAANAGNVTFALVRCCVGRSCRSGKKFEFVEGLRRKDRTIKPLTRDHIGIEKKCTRHKDDANNRICKG